MSKIKNKITSKSNNASPMNPMFLGMSLLLPLGSLIPLAVLAFNYYKQKNVKDDIDYSDGQ